MKYKLVPEPVPRQKPMTSFDRMLIEFGKMDVPSTRLEVPSLGPEKLSAGLSKAVKDAKANIAVLVRGDAVYLKVK